MSRYMQQYFNGEWIEVIDDPNKCRLLIDDVCCGHDSGYCADFPPEDYCERCKYFTPETGMEIRRTTR